MFKEFILFPNDEDPAGEYIESEGKIKIYLPHIYTYNGLQETIEHEVLHELFHWADEENWDSDKDHYMMRKLGFD